MLYFLQEYSFNDSLQTEILPTVLNRLLLWGLQIIHVALVVPTKRQVKSSLHFKHDDFDVY